MPRSPSRASCTPKRNDGSVIRRTVDRPPVTHHPAHEPGGGAHRHPLLHAVATPPVDRDGGVEARERARHATGGERGDVGGLLELQLLLQGRDLPLGDLGVDAGRPRAGRSDRGGARSRPSGRRSRRRRSRRCRSDRSRRRSRLAPDRTPWPRSRRPCTGPVSRKSSVRSVIDARTSTSRVKRDRPVRRDNATGRGASPVCSQRRGRP